MRELEARTGVHRETIRVYLRHDLIPQPSRPQRNVADYGEEHVEAIIAVRRLQTESRLSLPQIGAMISGQSTDRGVSANAFLHLERLVAARVGIDEHNVTLEALTARNKNARKDARALASVGVVRIIHDDKGDALTLTDAELVAIWGEMRSAGFVEDLNFRPEMLDFYVDAAEFVAGWEARTFLDRTEGWIDEDKAAVMIEHALPAMLNFFGLLRRKAFLRNIQAGQPAEPKPMRPAPDAMPSSARLSRIVRRAGPRSPR